MAKYALVQCCPVPTKMAPVIREILRESGATLQSAYRGSDARALLAKCGKHDQTYLYRGWVSRLPGFNPANPPGRSTHELRSDGVAYRGPRGRRLLWWQIGIDVDDRHVQAFIKTAAKHGYIVTVTYPSSLSEYHHVNFRKAPIYFRSFKKGARGPRVRWVQYWLKKLGYLKVSGNGSFGPKTDAALKAFQRRHKLTADGVYGLRTSTALHAAVRAYKKRQKQR